MVYESPKQRESYLHTVLKLKDRELLTEDLTLTDRGRGFVTKCFQGLDALVAPLHEALSTEVPEPEHCEPDRAIYTLTCLLWREFTPQERTTLQASAQKASLPKPALPLLAGAYVLEEALRRGYINPSGSMLNLKKPKTDRFTRQ
ncbi:MAG: hypothetical protein AABX37_01255 [Nanoarchaeota archaeon]